MSQVDKVRLKSRAVRHLAKLEHFFAILYANNNKFSRPKIKNRRSVKRILRSKMSQDSIIILSDSETETTLTPRKRKNLLNNPCSGKKTKQPLDSSCIFVSDGEDNNPENKCTPQKKRLLKKRKRKLSQPTTSEEISIVWASCRPSVECVSENNLFYVDTRPNMRNLIQEDKCPRPPRKKIKFSEKSPTIANVTSPAKKLRPIVIDGMNVGMAHTNGKSFSEQGLQIVVDHFQNKGHSVIVFIPQHMRSDKRKYLESMHKNGIIVFTPSRVVGKRRITCYDDNYILDYATKCSGIVISQDQYRDLYKVKPEWRDTIANRILVPTFVGNWIMFPEDPLGRRGPNLDQFLQM